jgi:signal transduction histidine kinase
VLRIAGFGFLFYALAEGLIAPKTMFFPASLINVLVNEQSVYETLGIPIGIFRSIVGAVIALFLFRSLLAFRIEADRVAESLQQQQALMAERERISRDLHDGTIQSIYAAGLMLDDVHHTLVNRQQPTEAGDKLHTVMGVLNTTIQEIRGYIYDLRRSVAGDEDLTRGLVDIVTEFRLRTGIPIDWDVSGCGKFALSPDRRQHVYQITREALSNILRHAKASHAKLQLRYQDCVEDVAGSVQLKISDNGSGNAPAAGKAGRGLRNMRERATLLDAQLDIISKPGKGTEVVLELKG